MSETFSRSDSGLSNKHLFHNVDFMVFVEGGGEGARPEDLPAKSLDEIFWTTVFDVFAPGSLSFKIQCHGGKNNLLDIAVRIGQGKIANVLVAVDRDYDDFAGRNPAGDKILITRGYSWENDAWGVDSCVRVFRTICPIQGDDDDIRERISQAFSCLDKDGQFLAWADSIMHCNGEPLLANKHERELISIGTDHIPRIDRRRLRTRLAQTRRRNRAVKFRRESTQQLRGAMDVRGKFVAKFSTEVVNGLMLVVGVREKVGESTATAIALRELQEVLRSNSENRELAGYYKGAFDFLNLAAPQESG